MILIDNYDLFVFDLDDTLVKTENYHYKAWLSVLKDEIDTSFYIDFNHFTSKFHSNKMNAIKDYLVNELFINEPDKIINKKNELYFKIINDKKNDLKLIDGACEFLKKIIESNKKFVIVSNSLKSNLDFFSGLFPILKRSSKNYYRELMVNRKPHPECYLMVVNDFPNSKIIGFEDSITGIHSISQVKGVDIIFVNNPEYYYYNSIIDNYKLKLTINDYLCF
jgi:beta-phosphoglucomutase-like phosphatase (HAD superfamily)